MWDLPTYLLFLNRRFAAKDRKKVYYIGLWGDLPYK